MHGVTWRITAFSLILGLALNALSNSAGADDALILGVHPYLPPKDLIKRFEPLAGYLGKAIGRPVEVRIGRNYDDHIEAIGKERIDIAFMGPVSYIKLVEHHGKKPILARLETNGLPTFRGTIVTRRESPLKTLAELKGKRFAFGDPDSTMSHLVPEHMLLMAGVRRKDLAEYRFLGGHHNVVLAVLAGDFDAGAVKDEVFREYAPKGLRALAETPAFSDHVFVTRATLPADTVQTLRAALLRLKTLPEGAAIMQSIKKDMTALIPAADNDYDNLRTVVKALESRHD